MNRSLGIFALVLAAALAFSSSVHAEDYQAEYSRALALCNSGKRIDALPLFEDLAARNPKDDKVLLQLAQSLIAQAAAADATNLEEGARLRVRARSLLLQAQDLGNHDSILKTDLELIPVDGKIVYAETPIDRASRAAEAAYSKGDFAEAIRHYQEMLAIDPKRYDSLLYIGDCYEQMKDYDKAPDWFERAIAVDPNRETAYRYYGVTLTKNGEKARARTKFIQAVVAEPLNPRARRALQDWSKTQTGADLKTVSVSLPASNAAVQAAYSGMKDKWRNGEFKARFPTEKEYRLSLPEETEALTAASEAAGGASDPDLAMLAQLRHEGLLEAYLLLSRDDVSILRDYNAYRAANRIKLENYLDEYVVPRVP